MAKRRASGQLDGVEPHEIGLAKYVYLSRVHGRVAVTLRTTLVGRANSPSTHVALLVVRRRARAQRQSATEEAAGRPVSVLRTSRRSEQPLRTPGARGPPPDR